MPAGPLYRRSTSPSRLPHLRLLWPLLLAVAPAVCQTGPAAPVPALTLNVQSRLVLEDVLVLDGKGMPVHGLPASAFHILDNGKPQDLRSFEEGAPPSANAPERKALPPGIFTNVSATGDQTASEVLLIDADTMEVTEQMFLLNQLRRSLRDLPPGLQVAVFRISNGRAVQIRGMSTDREDLLRAIHECIPFLPHATDEHFQSAVEQLATVSSFLEQIPGRKNILWFTGQFPLVPVDSQENVNLSEDFRSRLDAIHQLGEDLAEARVSVYPVDVRGVIARNLPPVGLPSSVTGPNPAAASGLGAIRTVAPPEPTGVAGEREQMRQLAQATGGKAYMLNDLSDEISQAFDLGVHAYTLGYSPTPYLSDNSWHTVRISVDGGYGLSYRRGYLATAAGLAGANGLRLEDGEAVPIASPGAPATRPGGGPRSPLRPVLFTVEVLPAPEIDRKPGSKTPLPVTVRFRIPTTQLDFDHRNAAHGNQLLVCAYAYDGDGKMRAGKLVEVDTSIPDEKWQHALTQQVAADQRIEVPHNAGYLLLVVRERTSKRIGSVVLPMRAVRSLAPATPAVPAPQDSPHS